nr:retrotransposon protein, putative, Ty1-copia subclass [Tanacetum cinerariifolium]
VGHWRRNCPSDHAELKKRKNASIASTSASGSHGLLEISGSDKKIELNQQKDTQPSENTSEAHNEVTLSRGNYKAALEDLESDKWLEAMYTKMQIKSGEAAYILGIKIIRDRSKQLISLSQSSYLEKNLKKFRMENSKKGYTLMMEKPDYR